jgi:citronellol/citronellal dehydrogenase
MGQLDNKVCVISGGSRGIGRAIALKLASEGANVAILAKTDQPHPKLEGTIHSVAKEIEAFNVESLAIKCDIRFEEQVQEAMNTIKSKWGKIDILINNASAIFLTNTEATEMKRFDLMHQVNTRGTYLFSKLALPLLKESENPHILNLSPPLNMDPQWFKNHLAYTMAKYGMSMCVLGMSAEFKRIPIAVNALWPKTGIATAAIEMLAGKEGLQACRTPEIMADATLAVVKRKAEENTGNFFIDEEILAQEGITDLEKYAVNPKVKLLQDFFI